MADLLEEAETTMELLETSLYVLIVSPNPRTMRLLGKIRGHWVVLLVDTGSTHNFWDASIITKAQLPMVRSLKLEVKIADGSVIKIIPLSYPYTASKIAMLHMQNVFKLHGLPSTIVSDQDMVFTRMF